MDEMGIRRMRKNVFLNIINNNPYEEGHIGSKIETFPEKDREFIYNVIASTQGDYFKDIIEEKMKKSPEDFEIGMPEVQPNCDFSCRGTTRKILRNVYGPGISSAILERPSWSGCNFRDNI
jgi:hypothetical protein